MLSETISAQALLSISAGESVFQVFDFSLASSFLAAISSSCKSVPIQSSSNGVKIKLAELLPEFPPSESGEESSTIESSSEVVSGSGHSADQ